MPPPELHVGPRRESPCSLPSPWSIFPHITRRLTEERTHKRQRFRPSRHGDQSFQHGLSGVACPNSVDGHNRGLRVNLGEHLKNVSHTFCPSPRGHGVLVRCSRCLHCVAELLGHRPCHHLRTTPPTTIPLTKPRGFWTSIILPWRMEAWMVRGTRACANCSPMKKNKCVSST